MSNKPYGPVTFSLPGVSCRVESDGRISFHYSGFCSRFDPNTDNPLKDLGDIRYTMISFGIEGRKVARIIDYGYTQSLRIRGVLR
ncbi:MAG: hypothetical protein GF368_04775 [Candidatus Aenigmarchaeota archaeon]|nr:hypothetical protein [Candidatus Aenigmarchaeota archaeon]